MPVVQRHAPANKSRGGWHSHCPLRMHKRLRICIVTWGEDEVTAAGGVEAGARDGDVGQQSWETRLVVLLVVVACVHFRNERQRINAGGAFGRGLLARLPDSRRNVSVRQRWQRSGRRGSTRGEASVGGGMGTLREMSSLGRWTAVDGSRQQLWREQSASEGRISAEVPPNACSYAMWSFAPALE